MEIRKGDIRMGLVLPTASEETPGEGPHATRRGRMTVPVRPKAKARPRMSKNGHVYTPKETKEYEKLLSEEWIKQNPGLAKLDGPLDVYMTFNFKRPKSHYDSKGKLKQGAPSWHTNVPDIDNIEKAVLDALNKVAFEDDKTVVAKYSEKAWSKVDEVVIRIMEL